MPGFWTRRRFLEAVGRAGGAAAAYEAMTAMGLLRVPAAFAGVPDLPPGNGKRILILGAGIAGLTAAYELNKKNYNVTILEAKSRPGGRNFTVRRGDTIEEITGTRQLCRFDEGLYLNAGPGRLPYHHTAVLEYCKVLGVPLEVYVMMSRANLFQTPDAWNGAPKTQRQIANDTRGWIADLLAKAIKGKQTLDKRLTASDRDALLDLLKSFGDLNDNYEYVKSSRSGYTIEPGITPCPEIIYPPLQLADLLKSDFWNHRFYQSEEYEWQPTLFEPVGGMDGIVRGFLGHVGNLIRYNREVIGVHNTPAGVHVDHAAAGTKGTAVEQEDADWCISTIPLPILKRIDNNFSEPYRDAVGAVSFAATCKVGWQANRRFWELDDQIYGGISYINHNITQMWYPSHDYFKEKGVLTGAYNYEKDAEEMAKLEPEARLVLAMEGAKRMHPRFDEFVPRDLGLSIAWKNVAYQLGGWAEDWDCPDDVYERLIRPEGHFWVAGDQVSDISGWQEGAIRSALYVLERIAKPELVSALPPKAAVGVAPKARTKAIKRRTRGLP